jgi:hypothetical protein
LQRSYTKVRRFLGWPFDFITTSLILGFVWKVLNKNYHHGKSLLLVSVLQQSAHAHHVHFQLILMFEITVQVIIKCVYGFRIRRFMS